MSTLRRINQELNLIGFDLTLGDVGLFKQPRHEDLVNAGRAQETYATLQSTLGAYIESEYVAGPAEASAPCELMVSILLCPFCSGKYALLTKAFLVIRNKFSHTLALLFLCTYPEQWPTFFTSISPLLHTSPGATAPTLNPHVTTFFLRLLLEISGEIHDQTIKSARTFAASRHARDASVRDAVREKDANGVNATVVGAIVEVTGRLEAIRAGGATASDGLGETQLVELVELAIKAFTSYVREFSFFQLGRAHILIVCLPLQPGLTLT